MAGIVDGRIASLGIILPVPAAPAANYLPFINAGNMLFTAGQLPFEDGKLVATGRLGAGLDLETGQRAARACAINVLAQAKAALGDLDRIERVVKITVFVASEPGFTDQHLVANGASDLIAELLGDAGRHARSAVGVSSLPLDAAVEIEAVIAFRN